MAIRASSSKQIDALIADLRSGTAVTREAAVARLTIIGARGVERLLELAESPADATARAAAFRALEAIADPRALGPALRALDDASIDAAVAVAAAGVARAFVRGARGASAVDGLSAVALDRARPEPVRIAALRALRELQQSTLAPLLKSLVDDPSPAVRAEAEARPTRKHGAPAEPLATLTQAAQAGLPNDPDALRHAIVRAGDAIALPLLLRIVERVREREALEPPAQRAPWTTTRAAAHVALANRGSRLALYDLRESIEATAPLPVEFLTALSIIGDASCLEAIGSAHARSRDAWWRTHLADAFRTIVVRERITRRHAVMKRVEKKWPGVFGN